MSSSQRLLAWMAAACVVALAPAQQATAATVAASAPTSALDVAELRVNSLREPLGVDDTAPELSWELSGSGTGLVQKAYQVRAATTADGLDSPDLWDSGRVESVQSSNVAWQGDPLASRMPVHWQVRAWDGSGRATGWSEPAYFEMGLLDEADWSGEWVSNAEWVDRKPTPVVVDLPEQDARYVRLTTTQLGLPLIEGGSPAYRLQLAEIVVRDSDVPDAVLSAGAAVSATDPQRYPGQWEPRFLTDGSLTSNAAPRGYSSALYRSSTPTREVSLTIDLGSVVHLDQLLLYPRTDASTDDGRSPNFPRDFSVATAGADQVFAKVTQIDDQKEPPAYNVDMPAMPLLAKQFELDGDVASARLYITGLGIYDAQVNGKPISDAVLQPGNTDYHDRIPYTVNDVTDLVANGANSLSVELGAGTSIVPDVPDRHTKWSGILGPPKLLAQLEVSYADGTTDLIVSDDSWRTTLGPTVFSHWYGGEDYDARLEPAGWRKADADLSGWDPAVTTTPPTPTTKLTAQMSPPIEPVDRLQTVEVTEPVPGTYLFDLGTNIAGWPVLNVEGPAGTEITLKPGERLGDDGLVDQSTMLVGGQLYPPMLDHYTLSGRGPETWHPRFTYHGFRYLQVTGLPGEPSKNMVEAIVLRAANEESGTFRSSNALLNSVHGMVNRAIQGNMYSILTDCPDREKLGWLEEMHLVFGSIARNYDVAAYYRDQIRNIAEAQQGDGSVPAIAPLYYPVFGSDTDSRNEPNWGSAMVLVPWEMYETYGDLETLQQYYPNMQRYLGYLRGRAKGNLLDYGLGDWGALDKSTPKGVTASFGYYRSADTLSRIAEALGKPADAAEYRALADAIAAAFNAKYLDTGKHSYGSGSQASDALALDLGIVPEEHEAAVLEHLIGSVEGEGNYLTVGEIALPSILRVLTAASREDLIFDAVTETKRPGYGYAVVHGATALPEYWDGVTGYGSQNHFMMGAIDEWFSDTLAGIRQQPGTVGFRELLIAPRVVGNLTNAEASYETPYGTVSSGWQLEGRSLHLDVTVPANTTAVVEVPTSPGQPDASGSRGARKVGRTDTATLFEVGSGEWKFLSHVTERVPEDRLQLDVQGPETTVPVVSGRSSEAVFSVHNLADEPVTLSATATASEGFAVEQPGTVEVPAHRTVEVPVRVTRESDTATGGEVTLTIGGETVTATLEATDNLLRLADPAASSTHSKWSVAGLTDGRTEGQDDYDVWNSGADGWNDATGGAFPDWVSGTWDEPVEVERVVMRTVGSTTAPAERFGLRDYDVQAMVDGEWQTVATVRGNTAATVTSTFPAVRASGLRLWITDSNDHNYSRIVELEAYGTP